MKCTFGESFINNMKEGDKNTGTERMWQQKKPKRQLRLVVNDHK